MAGLLDLKRHWIFHLNTENPYFVGGGFFRDNLLGVPPKDIDIWVLPSSMEEIFTKIRTKACKVDRYSNNEEESDWIGTAIGISNHRSSGDDPEVQFRLPISSFYKVMTWVGEVLDFIVVDFDHPSHLQHRVIESYDFTVNQIGWYWDGVSGHLMYERSVLVDLWNQTLKQNGSIESSPERIAYMEQKGFRL